ncbi:MAG: DMT family transporter [Gammaproteobacteria bacterium]|nr:DMT family transporter [Gammaproteobacteria bacterium]
MMQHFSRVNATTLKGTCLVTLSAITYGGIGYFGTEIMRTGMSVQTMLFWRFSLASIWILLFLSLSKNNTIRLTTKPLSSVIITFMLAIIAYSGSSAFYFLASEEVGTGVAMVIFFFYPIFIALFAFCFSSWRFNRYAFSALVAVTVGLLLLEHPQQGVFKLLGIILALIAALSYAIYVFMGKYTVQLMDAKWQTFFICLGNVILFFVVAMLTHSFQFPQTLSTWFNIFAIGIVGTAIPMQLLLEGLKWLSPLKAGILSVFEPIVTLILGFLLLHESISLTQMIGILVILLGAMLIHFDRVMITELVEENK